MDAAKEVIVDIFKHSGLSISDLQTDQFLLYYNLLVSWNEKMNLTSITEFDQVVLKHFADSAALLRYHPVESGAHIIDVGTGAGFPGIPLKIMRPDLHVTLLDSLAKRVRFLETVISELKLNTNRSIAAIHGRAEDVARDPAHRGLYDMAVSRAVSNISTITEYCVPFLKMGGIFAAYKSRDYEEELEIYQGGITKIGCSIEESISFHLQYQKHDFDRTLIFIKKDVDTPDQFPRRAGIPEKRPLK